MRNSLCLCLFRGLIELLSWIGFDFQLEGPAWRHPVCCSTSWMTSLTARAFFRVARVRFGSVMVWGWNGSSISGVRFQRFLWGKGFAVFQYRLTMTVPVLVSVPGIVPVVLVPLSVSGKTVPTVLVSGSGLVPEPAWFFAYSWAIILTVRLGAYETPLVTIVKTASRRKQKGFIRKKQIAPSRASESAHAATNCTVDPLPGEPFTPQGEDRFGQLVAEEALQQNRPKCDDSEPVQLTPNQHTSSSKFPLVWHLCGEGGGWNIGLWNVERTGRDICVYIYICCKVNNWATFWHFQS